MSATKKAESGEQRAKSLSGMTNEVEVLVAALSNFVKMTEFLNLADHFEAYRVKIEKTVELGKKALELVNGSKSQSLPVSQSGKGGERR